ncbi:MAG: hypothetical protein ACKVQJ_00625 [Pyrinomonadaceae bacterium]
MRVLCLVPNQKGYSPGQRGSIELWEKALNEVGITIVYAPFETDELRSVLYTVGSHFAKAKGMIASYAKRYDLLRDLDEFDAVFVYREAALLGPAFFEKMVAKKKPIIYQLDDPLFVPYKSNNNGYLSYLKFFGKIKEIIRISTTVMVNSPQIRDYAAQFNNNLWLIPSIVDEEEFFFKPNETNEPCIGWSGSHSTLTNLKLIERPLQRISGRCPLHFIGGTDFKLESVEYTAQPWSLETEADDLRKMQIGLIPLPQSNPWNKYKFIMKTSQYMTLGIVPIGTRMASNLEFIRPGENGFLADSDDEWYESMMTLISDRDLREKMSRLAAKEGQEKFTLAANKTKVIEAFRSAVR